MHAPARICWPTGQFRLMSHAPPFISNPGAQALAMSGMVTQMPPRDFDPSGQAADAFTHLPSSILSPLGQSDFNSQTPFLASNPVAHCAHAAEPGTREPDAASRPKKASIFEKRPMIVTTARKNIANASSLFADGRMLHRCWVVKPLLSPVR